MHRMYKTKAQLRGRIRLCVSSPKLFNLLRLNLLILGSVLKVVGKNFGS